MKRGFIITEINEKKITSTKDLEKIFNSEDKEFQLGGVYPNYQGSYYYTIKVE